MSLKHLFHIIAVCFGFYTTSLFAQTPKIKKITKITCDYGLINFGGKTTIDTIVEDFDIKGEQIIKPTKLEPNAEGYISCGVTTISQIKSEIIDSTKEKIIRKIFWSDSTISISIQNFYKDSTIYMEIKEKDTISKRIMYLKNKKTIKMTFESNLYEKHQITLIKRNNFFIRKWEEKDKGNNNVETTKFIANKVLKKLKQYAYNKERKEWFLEKKEKYNSIRPDRKLLRKMEQSYHDYHKVYFKTFTKYKYNLYGQIILESVKDHYKTLQKKVLIFYEYY